jgi:1-acyl-sn-glycerol-3-phosphate acyltransferase
VFIDRSDPIPASAAIRAAGERMAREGLSLVFFPEGTRSPDGVLRRFKKGSFALAIETQADLVPLAIDGGARVLPKGAGRVRPGIIRLECAPAVTLRGLTTDDRDDLTRRTRETVENMLEGLQARGDPPLPQGEARPLP